MPFKNSISQVVLVLVLSGLFFSCEKRVQIYPYKRVIKLGDDMAWARPDYDDSAWDKTGSTSERGIFWVRFEVLFSDYIDSIDLKGLQQISQGSYEAYWDGVLIGQNGQVGVDKQSEVPGRFISDLLLPDSLCTKGKHVLALRVSNWNERFVSSSWNIFFVEGFQHATIDYLRLTSFMYFMGGAYFLSALYYLLLFFTNRKEVSRLIFALCCLSFFLLIILEYLKFFYHYPYYLHGYRLVSIGLVNLAIACLVPVFLSVYFKIPYRRYLMSVYVFILLLYATLVGFFADDDAQNLSLLMLCVAIVLTLAALFMKRRGSIVMIIAFMLISVLNYFSNYSFRQMLFNYDINLFLSFTILVLAMVYLMVQRNKELQVAYEASLLQSERLKNELLRKNIQPHFIMNTLTAIMEWVVVSPKKSITFIEALAGEFEILNEIADLTLIPVSKEITLCKRHLETMSFRKETAF
ncbi:MAG: histidine kinase, partial [Bacteroidota bacterium]